jgi:hypothetical protein
MSVSNLLARTVAIVIGAAVTLALVASSASAHIPPDPEQLPISCACSARLDAIAAALRAQGFSGPAAQNFAVLTQRDCMTVSAS